MPGIESLLGKANPYMQAAQVGVSTIAGTMQIIQSIKQNNEAKDLSKKLITPFYKVQQGFKDNQALSESLAGQGLSDQARAVYDQSSANQLGSSVNAILRGGGDVSTISDLYDNAAQHDMNLAMLEEEIRQKNLQSYMKQNETMAGETEKQWMINQYAPYQDQKQLIAQLKQQANDNKWKGINTIGGGVNNFVQGQLLKDGSPADSGGTVRDRTTNVQPTNNVGSVTPMTSSGINNAYMQHLINRVIPQ